MARIPSIQPHPEPQDIASEAQRIAQKIRAYCGLIVAQPKQPEPQDALLYAAGVSAYYPMGDEC